MYQTVIYGAHCPPIMFPVDWWQPKADHAGFMLQGGFMKRKCLVQCFNSSAFLFTLMKQHQGNGVEITIISWPFITTKLFLVLYLFLPGPLHHKQSPIPLSFIPLQSASALLLKSAGDFTCLAKMFSTSKCLSCCFPSAADSPESPIHTWWDHMTPSPISNTSTGQQPHVSDWKMNLDCSTVQSKATWRRPSTLVETAVWRHPSHGTCWRVLKELSSRPFCVHNRQAAPRSSEHLFFLRLHFPSCNPHGLQSQITSTCRWMGHKKLWGGRGVY